jgi:transcription initiation factor TFIIIB Brf1 subunit/transcription initiation factor TFIIB
MNRLNDAEMVEVVELLCLAVELCHTADRFVTTALERIAGIGSGPAGLAAEAERLAAMLTGAPTLRRTTEASR